MKTQLTMEDWEKLYMLSPKERSQLGEEQRDAFIEHMIGKALERMPSFKAKDVIENQFPSLEDLIVALKDDIQFIERANHKGTLYWVVMINDVRKRSEELINVLWDFLYRDIRGI